MNSMYYVPPSNLGDWNESLGIFLVLLVEFWSLILFSEKEGKVGKRFNRKSYMIKI